MDYRKVFYDYLVDTFYPNSTDVIGQLLRCRSFVRTIQCWEREIL